jgi:phage antirepressor YoqD-like protein
MRNSISESEGLLTIRQAALVLGLKPAQVRKLVRENRLVQAQLAGNLQRRSISIYIFGNTYN